MSAQLRKQAATYAKATVDRLDSSDRMLLSEDVFAFLEGTPSIRIRHVEAATTAGFRRNCWVAGSHQWLPSGDGLISINAQDPVPRQKFTALHEYCHHLYATTDAYYDLNDHPSHERDELLEYICDAFASECLFGHLLADIQHSEGPEAADVFAIRDRSGASDWAACMAAATLLPHEGWIAVADQRGVVAFAAPANLNFGFSPTAAGDDPVPQLELAVRQGQYRGTGDFVLHTGTRIGPYNLDALSDHGCVFAVYTKGPGTWGGHRLDSSAREHVLCQNCDHGFIPFGSACRRCKAVRCPRCNRCACLHNPSTEPCPACHLIQPPAMYRDGSTVCRNCG